MIPHKTQEEMHVVYFSILDGNFKRILMTSPADNKAWALKSIRHYSQFSFGIFIDWDVVVVC